jgi:hypothetical protein
MLLIRLVDDRRPVRLWAVRRHRLFALAGYPHVTPAVGNRLTCLAK